MIDVKSYYLVLVTGLTATFVVGGDFGGGHC